MVFRVWGLGRRFWGLGFGVQGLGFGVWGARFGVWGLGSSARRHKDACTFLGDLCCPHSVHLGGPGLGFRVKG